MPTIHGPAGHFRSPRTSSPVPRGGPPGRRRGTPRALARGRLRPSPAAACGLARLLRWGRVLLQDEGGVVSAKAEAVAECDVDLESARLVGHAIECAARVGLFVVDR